MKTKALLIPAVIGMFVLASCKSGPSEETMKAVADFETAWGTLGQGATAWSADLKGTVDNCTATCTKNDAAVVDAWPEDMKTKWNDAKTACANDKAAFEAMWQEWTTFQTAWEADSKAWAEWKEKLTKGEVDDAGAKTALADWTKKMEEAKAKVDGWNSAYTAAKESCMKNCDNCAALEKQAADMAAADPKAKKG